MIRILAVLLLAFPAFGASVQVGTDAGFSNGMSVTPGTFTGATDVAPFNTISGGDNAGPSASFSFTISGFGTPSGVTSASILLSLYDLDSSTANNQIGSFTLNGLDLTSSLNAVAEANSATTGQISLLSLNLPAAAFPIIETGTVTVSLLFAGPVDGPIGPLPFNGGGIDFARLTYDTGVVLPEPSSFLLAATGALGLLLRKRLTSHN